MKIKGIYKEKKYKRLWIDFYNNKIKDFDGLRKTGIIFLVLIIIFVFFSRSDFFKKYWQNKVTRSKSLKDSTLCSISSDCYLYDCTNCGNKYWIDKNYTKSTECHVSPAGLIGCACVDSVCKRVYKKK